MFVPMQSRYSDFQDYYPPLDSQSPSSSPRSPSPSLPPRSPSLAPSSLHDRAARRSSHAYPYPYRSAHAPPAPPTSIPLDDNFDAPTTEAPTEWALRSHVEGDGHPEYEESVTGYQNYVVEMERMLEGQMESAARAQERMRQAIREREREREAGGEQQGHASSRQRKTSMSPTLRRIDTSINESAHGGSSRPSGGHHKGHGSHLHTRSQMSPAPVPVSPPPENARQVSGKKGRLELVEQRVLEDSAARTISLWRERVAASSAGGSRCGDSNVGGAEKEAGRRNGGGGDGRSEAGSHVHRRVPSGSASGDPRLRRVVSDHPRYASSVQGGGSRSGSVRAPDGGKHRRASASYERSEYMVSYHNTKGGFPKEILHPLSEAGTTASVRQHRTPSSPTTNKTHYETPSSPSLRRHAARKSLDRSEYMITYPQTPPLTGSQASSGSPTGKRTYNAQSPPPLRSPLHGSFRDMREALTPPSDTSALKATTTSSVEAILAACDPSLLHIAPVLHELGIKRVDHLRAVARLSEETRDREVKEQALRRGVTVVEWAIFLDKLQTL
ncbi:hypothetical protein OH77DRAFT_1422481 [Trametes cingulata]|nr:hypothetical protein OH77DRAFT_1422481 [Trametes cingulata]